MINAYCSSGTSPTSVTASRTHRAALRSTEPFDLEHGRTLPAFEITYETVGNSGGPPVLCLGGISAGHHVCSTDADPSPGWWDAVVGGGRAIDTTRYRVIGLDYLTGCESGAADREDRTAHITVTTNDQARIIARLLDQLGLDALAAIVGSSYGGMVALAFAAAHPERVRQLVIISAAHRTHPMATALRSVQRDLVRFAVSRGAPARGLALARAIAMTTYRSAHEFAERFDGTPDFTANGARFPVDAYLERQGSAFAKRFSANAFLTLSESIDLHAVDPAAVRAPTTLVAVDSDTLVPPWLMEELSEKLDVPQVVHRVHSAYGHDAFLKEDTAIGSVVRTALDGTGLGSTRSQRTGAVRAAIAADREHAAVMPPIHLSATFAFDGYAQPRRYDYTRSGNPTRDYLADALSELEGGAGTVVTASGLGAITTVLQLLRPDDLLIAPFDCYGGTQRLLDSQSQKGCFRLSYVDPSDPAALTAAFDQAPAMIWVETPSNPLLRITDLALVRSLARRHGCTVVVDNTFLSPALQQPIAFGADVVVHSTTKYLNGHSDVVGGAVVSARPQLHEQLAWWANCLGVTGAPFDSYLTLRGLRTLHARIAAHAANTDAIVAALVAHPAVARVYHPSLPHHPGHAIAGRQQSGFGSVVSFELSQGLRGVRAFVNGLAHFTLAESLGGVESLVAHPASMTHASMDGAAQSAAGITDGLLRLSVGIEDPRDLVADLVRALDRAGGLR